ncbi:hypothetical protein NDI76_15880 [Halogeometricum sp. S1BR25-6]|uniref:Uncharacterized protein n=1 Tax=Halogeometricum salsisoli TaxID=2950536 RepID=A0ABU2GHC3_9EURY|nr:hypothetical protein [Halogeometricum sp. S1BR25-6]MDS0300227.1 hypothetical protein [Halogeometricum sp. S1BR25-6]
MATTKADAQEPTVSIAGYLADAMARSFTLGMDADGYSHHYYRPADAVVVYDGRELDHYQPLAGRSLDEWREFVELKRGWVSMGPLAALGLRMNAEHIESIR